MIRIVTDSTCDLPTSVLEQYNIAVVPAWVNVGTRSMTDGIELTHTSFYGNLARYDTHPTTAAPAPGVFAEAYAAIANEGATEVVSIHVSADLSGFLNSARLGAETVADRLSVTLVDSRNVSLGLGLLVLAAARLAADGASRDEIVNELNKLIPRTIVYCACDTLEYLRRSGRVGFATAGVGSLLRIKPILIVKDGVATSFDRVRTSKKIVPKLLTLLEQAGELSDLAVIHASAPASANDLVGALRGRFPKGSSKLVATIGPAIGCHIGPGAVGLAYIAKL